MTFVKLLGLAVVAGPMLLGGLTPDGEKYLAEAKKRITTVEKSLTAAKADPAKADAAKDDLLASKRFLDNVQAEQPKNREAAALQKKADKLLADLRPTLVKTAIKERVGHIEEMLTTIDQELAVAARDEAADARLRDHFDMLRQMVHEVLEKEPANPKALAARDRENALWEKYRQQREAKKGGQK